MTDKETKIIKFPKQKKAARFHSTFSGYDKYYLMHCLISVAWLVASLVLLFIFLYVARP